MWLRTGDRGWSSAKKPTREISLRCTDHSLTSMPWSDWIGTLTAVTDPYLVVGP